MGPYELAHFLVLRTRSRELHWSLHDGAVYTATYDGTLLELYLFQRDVRGPQHVVLRVSKGVTRKTICEPSPHISALPIGKVLYFLAALWNYVAPAWLSVRFPYQPETAKEEEDERLRLMLRELYRMVSESN